MTPPLHIIPGILLSTPIDAANNHPFRKAKIPPPLEGVRGRYLNLTHKTSRLSKNAIFSWSLSGVEGGASPYCLKCSPLLVGWSEASFLLAYATRGEGAGVRVGKTRGEEIQI